MNKIIFQVVLVVVSVILFFTFTDPMYRGNNSDSPGIKSLQAEILDYNEAIDKSEELIKQRERLLTIKNSIDPIDRADLEKLLPDSIDNIRLLIDTNSIAKRYGLVLKNLRFTGDGKNPSSSNTSSNTGIEIGGDEKLGVVDFGFSVVTRYDTFKLFLKDLEKSLRILDVTELSITPTSGKDTYDFTISLKTYWLR